MKTITELKKELEKIRIKGNTRLFTIKEINKIRLLRAQLSTLIEVHKEELEFLKNVMKQTEGDSMIYLIEERIKELEKNKI